MIRKVIRQCASLPKLIKHNYHEKVIDHYENPRNVGSLDKTNTKVGTGLVGAPACGDVMKLQIEVSEDGSTIEKAVFKVLHSPCRPSAAGRPSLLAPMRRK